MRSLLRRMAGALPAPLARRLARHGVAAAAGVVLLLLLGATAVLALAGPGGLGITAARVSQTRDLGGDLLTGELAQRDSDHDGLSDALENYLYGTDPEAWDSSGTGIPDGWLVQFGFDPLSPTLNETRGAAPPPSALPAAYERGYPVEYTPLLRAYYEHGKPEEWRPGVDAPWWRGAPHADPSRWDQDGAGIPTGWLLHHGLAVSGVEPDEVAQGGLGNLTLRQAFEHDVHPLLADSDRDGLDDWVEIHVTRTDPARLSTAGTGIGDGWLLHFRLDPFDPAVASQDPDVDGLTNLEEYVYSADRYRNETPSVVWTRGLDPTRWETARTGIPDGWYVRYGLDPFGAETERVIGRASDFPDFRDRDSIPDFNMTLRDAYRYGRPSTWDEATQGVWWGGTNPATLDTDNDGLPDPVEIRGWNANATFETGPEAKPTGYRASSNPLEPDSDGDGLTDAEEYRGRASCAPGAPARGFPPTNPRNRDTAFSGLSDLEKACGVVRGEARYDLLKDGADGDGPRLDPTKADSAGDHMRDGPRLAWWHARHEAYEADPRYPYPGSAYRSVHEWTARHARFAGMDRDAVVAQFRPDGDVDGDGVMNALDADPGGGLLAEKEGPGTPKTKVYFLGGPQMDPVLYRFTEHASTIPRVPSDPSNPDTDGDGLPDAWEVRYGRFDPAKDGWDLDPAKADSDGDGTTDDKANNDGDVVTWYAYHRRGGGIERVAHAWPYDNLLEFVAGTHPGELSSANDGVPDGWKAFWGSRIRDDTYPNLLSARDPRVGDVALAVAGEVEAALAQSPIQPTASLRGLESKASGYVRILTQPLQPGMTDRCAGLLGQVDAARGEVALQAKCFEGDNLTGIPLKILPVEGVHALTYADEARLRTNPYVADSDGDGAPDAYEAYHLGLVRGRTHPDPAVPDGTRDADGDGLSLTDECLPQQLASGPGCGRHGFVRDGRVHGAGADPHAADSDSDGIRDDIESNAQLDLLDPSDLEGFRDPTRDADGDRVPDYQELTGWGKSSFGETLRTDPQDADTDGDALLDGPSVTLRPATDAARIAAWKSLGMAHVTGADGGVTFLGENTTYQATGSLPTKADSVGKGIPDGWFAYHLKDPRDPNTDLAAYKENRPAWWDEARHGVWWWGRVPGQDPVDDADGDSLHDRNGEDPLPGTAADRITRGIHAVTDLRDLEGFVKAGATAMEVRVRAQMAGDEAGNPLAMRRGVRLSPQGIPVTEDRARVALVDVVVETPIVTKGVAFDVSGRVVLNETDAGGNLLEGSPASRVGVPNRAVLVSMFAPDASRVVGAGFTDAQGRFTLRANLTTDVRVPIPQPGMVLLGAAKGTAVATFDPAGVSAGTATAGVPNALVVWTTNTSATAAPGSPQYGDHKARVRDAEGHEAVRTTHATRFAATNPIPVTVRSDARLTTSVADTVENGGRLVGDLRLTDASGGPIVDARVTFRWTGAPLPIEFVNFTDRAGRVNLTNLNVPASVQRPDEYALTATFASADPNLRGATLSHGVRVLSPTLVAATLPKAGATVGESVLVEGVVQTRSVNLTSGAVVPGGPVAGAVVRVGLGGVESTTRADDLGRFSARVGVPGSLTAGTHPLVVRFAGGEREAPSEATLALGVRRTSSLVDLTRVEGPRFTDAALKGRLVDNEGQGFTGDVEVFGGAARLAGARTDPEGRFSVAFPLAGLPLGTQTLRVVFPGDLAHGPAENLTQARVTSATTLTLEGAPALLTRGASFTVRGLLLDDAGVPVARQAVHVHWRGERVASVVTDDEGAWSALVATNLTERPAATDVAAEYVPPPGSVLKGSSARSGVDVHAGTRITLEPGTATRGPITLAGRLTDDHGRPIAGAPVTLWFADEPFTEARTDRNGTFQATRQVPFHAPLGNVTASARYAGAHGLAGSAADAPWRLRTPATLEVARLDALVRGESATLDARVVDDRGEPLDAEVRLVLGGHDLGAHRSVDGKLRLTLTVPKDAPRGAATLWLNATPTAEVIESAKALPVSVKIRPRVDVDMPTLAIRGLAVAGEVRLRDDHGEPLRNASFTYTLGRDASPVTGRTDADGRALVGSVAPPTGETTLALTVRAGPDVLAASYTSPTLRLVGPETPVGYAAIVAAVAIVLVLAGLVLALALLRRRQLEEAREIVQDAIEELLAGNEYQATIFLAYRRFSAHLARHGHAEKAADTPREFASGVRKALPVTPAHLRGFIQLFEEARYSDHAIGTEERDRAVEQLARVRNEIDTLLGRKAVVA